ncbi:PRA1 family protein-domain-containing protein [Aspergillus lucknowensis]|uniref:PRA1 family protein-domain-containing protein n=1 Tax=Aspergillus lucknowensis TaxID=176173 RepID=A0ABR4LJ57_9EURO
MSPIQIPIEVITSRFGDRFNSLRSQSFGSRFANLRPISEFLDFKRISKPANFGEAQSRINYNLSYFSSNYAAIFVMLSIYSLLTNPVLLFVIFLVSGGLWGIGKLGGRDLDLGFARFNTSQLYTGLLLVAVPLGFWASPFATFLWLVGATGKLATPQDGGIGWQRSMMGHYGYNNMPRSVDGADYNIYEDTDSTVAYAVQLAMGDNEEWMVEKVLERIRRAHSEGQKNVTLSKRELEALERKRQQAAPQAQVDKKRLAGRRNGAAWRNGPRPLDTSVYCGLARTTGSSVSPQSSTTTPRSPVQPPFPGSLNHDPAFSPAPSIQRIVPYQVPPAWESIQPMHSPSLPGPVRASYANASSPVLAPEPVEGQNNDSGNVSSKKRSPASTGDEVHIVEVMEHKVPSSSSCVAGRRSRQHGGHS